MTKTNILIATIGFVAMKRQAMLGLVVHIHVFITLTKIGWHFNIIIMVTPQVSDTNIIPTVML